MSIRSNLNGDFDKAALDRLSFPIAWSGTTHIDDRNEEEAELSEFIEEAREAIRTCPDAYAVEVKDGEITGTLVSEDD